MLVVGLTGGVAAGKSTVAAMFAAEGCAVFDADKTVHALYRGVAAPLIGAAFPGSISNGAVDRAKLGEMVARDPQALRRLESIVHPLVRDAEEAFRTRAARAGARVLVLDIPLLFETGADKRSDAIVVVTASANTQRERIATRGGMTKAEVAALVARQMGDEERRLRAHFIIDTDTDLEATRRAVASVLRALAGRAAT